jgi:xanthine dehydrogenase accessory factor
MKIYEELLDAQRRGEACAVATVIETRGSIPREAGAKMIVFAVDRLFGTIGGGKFEALVIADCLKALESGQSMNKTYPLHEKHADSFGAICGGEVSVFIEPHLPRGRLVLIGGGHCACAIARAAQPLGYQVLIIEDRPTNKKLNSVIYLDDLSSITWRSSDAVAAVSRNYEIDTDALAQILPENLSYIGMIGSRKKVRTVMETLRTRGFSDEQIGRIYAPIGLDIGADSPEEIAIAVLAELLKVRTQADGKHLSTT